MKKVLPEKEIGQNLKQVIQSLNMTNKAFAEEIGEKRAQAISNYINCTGGRFPSNIVSKLVTIGINANWYLTGHGEMFAKDAKDLNENEKVYLEIGKHLHEVYKKLYGLEQKKPG